MDIIPELLAPVLLGKLEKAKKDRNQNSKQYQQTKSSSVDDSNSNEDKKATLVTKTSSWGEADRRSTNDRRKQMAKRGRWLESRDSSDRRRNKEAISITI